jgi:hypothetical protein
MQCNIPHLYGVNRVHDGMLLEEMDECLANGGLSATRRMKRMCSQDRTAIPAKAPAAIFWTREKLGGRVS